MKPRGGDEGGDHADEVVVHVAWVAQCGGGGGHHSRHLVDHTYIPHK